MAMASFDDFAEDLLGERAFRPLLIVGASKVDSLLVDMLKLRLLPQKNKLKDGDELLEGDNPLSTFSSRIKMAYRLGLLDESLYTVLNKLRVIRNDCAHLVRFEASSSPAREHLADLKRLVRERESFRLAAERYFQGGQLTSLQECQCALLSVCVVLQAILQATEKLGAVAKAITISAR